MNLPLTKKKKNEFAFEFAYITSVLLLVCDDHHSSEYQIDFFVSSTVTIRKIREDTAQWFLSQDLQNRDDNQEEAMTTSRINAWSRPQISWQKCNIGVAWNKKDKTSGASWVLRNDHGIVVLHGRRSFAGVQSFMEANMCSWSWAIESMGNLGVLRVIFAAKSKELIGAVTRPPSWPSLRYFSSTLLVLLSKVQKWRLVLEKKLANKGADLIASSALNRDLMQSYIAFGSPGWLRDLFSSESELTSV